MDGRDGGDLAKRKAFAVDVERALSWPSFEVLYKSEKVQQVLLPCHHPIVRMVFKT